MGNIINFTNYRLKKAMDLEKAIAILETANASAREAENVLPVRGHNPCNNFLKPFRG